MAEWPCSVEVALMIDSNMRQPLSCHVSSPVMRYMYQTDSMASGLHTPLERGDGVEEEKALPEDVFPRLNGGETGGKRLLVDYLLDVFFVGERLARVVEDLVLGGRSG